MKDKRAIALVFICLMLATVSSIFVCYARMNAEKNDNSVSIVLDYSDIERLSDLSGDYIVGIMETFKAAGADSVAVTEDIDGNLDINKLGGIDPKKLNLYYYNC